MKCVALVLLTLAALTCAAADATAQSLAAALNRAEWDASVSVGSLLGERRELNEWDSWYRTGSFSAEVGRHWTSHLKTSITVGRSGEGRLYAQRQLASPGSTQPVFLYEQHFFERTHLSAGVSYQFFENAWVHPSVTGGLDHTWERDRIASQQIAGRVTVPSTALTRTTQRAN